MPRNPRVSILLPVRDAAATLPACLESLRRQTFRDWRCIAVDDGSKDASPELLRRAAASDPRFRPVGGPRRGLVGALNAGLEHCAGDVVVRMDADDAMRRDRIARQVAALDAHPEWSAVGAHVRCFPRRALGAGMRAYEAWLCSIDSPERVRRDAFVECPVAHPTLAIRTDALRALRYRDRGWPEDYDLVLRLLLSGRQIGVVPRRLVLWRHGPARHSHTSEVYSPPRFTACKASFLAASFLADSDRYVLWGYGGTGRALRRALGAHGKRPAAIVELHPGRLGQTIHGAPVIPPADLASRLADPLLVSVAGARARGLIRAELSRAGLLEGTDYVCAA